MQTPDFLTIGHACHDWTPQGYIPGGAVTYSSLFAKKLGLQSTVLTSVGPDFLFDSLFENIVVQKIPATHTTVFKNDYQGSFRQQYLLERAHDINSKHLPSEWGQSKMVLICPIANEVDQGILGAFDEETVIAVCPQGWMRRWDESKKVFHEMMEDFSLLSKADFTIISEDDVNNDQSIIKELASLLKVLVVTKSEQGCDLYIENSKHSIPAFKTDVIDSTGAGDIFATAFLLYYNQYNNYFQAGRYANVAASYCVESKGIEGIPNQTMIENRYSKYLK